MMLQTAQDTICNDKIIEIAQRFKVYPAIHQKDFIFHYHKNNPVRNLHEAVELYYHIGNDSARRLREIIDKCMPLKLDNKLSVFEFAAGYGCVTRHLNMHNELEIIPCDIHDEAVKFMSDNLGVSAILSSTQPQNLNLERRFDVVFALSFFTHMPASTWTAWFEKLFSLVDDGGIFIFTTHGFAPWQNIGLPHIEENGFWFSPASEQKDLSTADYGCTITLPHYVLGRIRTLTDGELVFYEQKYWGGLAGYICCSPTP